MPAPKRIAMGTIIIKGAVTISEEEIDYQFIRSSGPGGQNVNKVETGVLLLFNASASRLPDEVKSRLFRLAGRRISQEGVLAIKAQRFRSQEGNRREALHRLIELLRKACERPKPRKPTRPTQTSVVQRLESKRRTGRLKKERKVSSKQSED